MIQSSGDIDSKEKRLYPPLCHKVKQTSAMEETTIKGVDIPKPFCHFSPQIRTNPSTCF